MDSKNSNRIQHAINTINSVTTDSRETAEWLLDLIEQLEEIRGEHTSETRVDAWRKMLRG